MAGELLTADNSKTMLGVTIAATVPLSSKAAYAAAHFPPYPSPRHVVTCDELTVLSCPLDCTLMPLPDHVCCRYGEITDVRCLTSSHPEGRSILVNIMWDDGTTSVDFKLVAVAGTADAWDFPSFQEVSVRSSYYSTAFPVLAYPRSFIHGRSLCIGASR